MFENAIEMISGFTRPIHFIRKIHGAPDVESFAATLFFVNDQRDAITCKHVADNIRAASMVNSRYKQFRLERDASIRDAKGTNTLGEIERRHGIAKGVPTHVDYTFIDFAPGATGISWRNISHPTEDLEILRFEQFNPTGYTGHAMFLRDSTLIKVGNSLCRLGYPFAEFSNFRYDDANDALEWTPAGLVGTPRFPIDGIVTRFAANSQGKMTEIEMSTPGLMGMSGCPLFNKDGVIYGMQSHTISLHLGMDFAHSDRARNVTATIYPYMHLGRCIHVDVIKEFLRANNVPFAES